MLVTFSASSRLQMGYIFCWFAFLPWRVRFPHFSLLPASFQRTFFMPRVARTIVWVACSQFDSQAGAGIFFSLFPHLVFEIRVKSVRAPRKWAKGKKEGICWCISCSVRSVKARLDSFATNSVTSLCLAMLWGSEKKKKASFLCNFNSCLLVSVLSVFVRTRLHITENVTPTRPIKEKKTPCLVFLFFFYHDDYCGSFVPFSLDLYTARAQKCRLFSRFFFFL